MHKHYKEIIKKMGEDINRDGLKDTPMRAEKAMQYLTHGYTLSKKEVINDALFECNSDDLVVVKSIELYSLCEHHLLPFYGVCHIGYLPNSHVLGLSKLGRIVDLYSRRLQVQERLTQQIAEFVAEVTNSRGTIVMIDAKHLCMMMRGIQKQNAQTLTLAVTGELKTNTQLRAEFERMIQL